MTELHHLIITIIMVAVVIICNYLDTKFIVFSSKKKKKKKSQITYLLQCFSLFRAQVSGSSAHVCDHKMKTELLQSQMNRQAQSQKRKNTVSVRGRRVCESDACPWCSSTASVSCYPRCQLPVEETAVGGGGGRKDVNTTVTQSVWGSCPTGRLRQR